jgi:hypothetical protein
MERIVYRVCAVLVLACVFEGMGADERPGKYVATLSDGTTVELVGLRCYSARVPEGFEGDEWQWWRPDGTVLPQVPDHATTKATWNEAYRFAVHFSGQSDCSFVAVGAWNEDINPEKSRERGSAFGEQDDLRLFWLRFAPGQKIADVRLGVATGPWMLVQEWPFFWKNPTPDSVIFRSSEEVILRCPEQNGGHVVAEVIHGFAEEATRLVVFDAAGKQHVSRTRLGGEGAGLVRYIHRFESLKTEDIKRIEFQKRPYDHWIEFRDVSLRPGRQTRPRVEIEEIRTGLAGSPLPRFNTPRIDAAVENARGKRILLCFWDIGQRPSRNCIHRLAKQQAAMESKGVVVIPVHISSPGEDPPSEWLEKNRVPLLTETLEDGRAKARQIWGVRLLPWLVLTDSNHVVTAEGITLDELDQQLN